jgi:DNA-binding MarR family transcriptional regulator
LLIDEDGRRQNELAREAHLSAPTVSATLRRMESEGLIERRDCTSDARAVRVYLTAQGRRQHEAMISMLRSLDAVTMQGFDEAETAQLHALLGRMRENLINSLVCEGTEGEGK